MLHRISLLVMLAFAVSPVTFGQNETVVVRPEPSDEILVNPGMGITTFQRFNGQPLNQGLRWSEEGPTAKQSEASVRSDFPNTTIAYCRWFWNELQPTPEHIRCQNGIGTPALAGRTSRPTRTERSGNLTSVIRST